MTQCRLKEEDRAELFFSAGSRVPDSKGESHLRECASCAQTFAAQAAVWSAMDSWTVPEVSSDFDRRLYARIDAASAQPWHERFAREWRALWTRPSLAFGVAALALIFGFALDHTPLPKPFEQSSQNNPSAVSALPVSASEAEQVEKTLEDLDMLRQFDATGDETLSKSM